MKGQTKAKLIVFFIVAIIAFAASSIAANIILIKNPNFPLFFAFPKYFQRNRSLLFISYKQNDIILVLLHKGRKNTLRTI